MKIRKDYVTNSSSSSFMIARKETLTEKQKEKILDTVLYNMMGHKIASTKEELIEWIKKEEYVDDVLDENGELNEDLYRYEEYKEALKAIEKGLSIYSGYVSFEGDYDITSLYEDIWEAAEDEDNFIEIDTDLSY